MDNSSSLTPPCFDKGNFSNSKVAILGAGGVASFAHIPAYQTLGLEVTALVDSSQDSLKKAQAALGSSIPAPFSSIEAFIEDPLVRALDMIDLALPSPAHEATIDKLLDRLGKQCPNILVQKPLAQTYDAAIRLLEKAKACGCRIFVNLNGRFVPTFSKAQSLIVGGAIGTPRTATILNRGLNTKKPGEWRGALSQLILYEMAIHHFDFLIWSLGAVRTVQAVTQTAPHLGVAGEAYASVLLRFENDVVANITEDWTCHASSAWRYHPNAEEVVVSGSLGTVHVTPKHLSLTAGSNNQNWQTDANWFPDAFAGPMAEALNATRELRPSMLDGSQHSDVLKILEAAYWSASTEQTATLVPPSKEGKIYHAQSGA